MIDTAIADYLESVVRTWCSTAAAWAPPGDASDELCDDCIHSPFAVSLDLVGWPHAAVHPLITALEGVVTDVRISLTEEHEEAIAHDSWTRGYLGLEHGCVAHDRAAREYVGGRALAYYPLVQDVLLQCVTPRVRRYVTGEVERGMSSLRVSQRL